MDYFWLDLSSCHYSCCKWWKLNIMHCYKSTIYVAGIYHKSFNFANFTNFKVFTKIKASTWFLFILFHSRFHSLAYCMCSFCEFLLSILPYFKPVENHNGEQQVKLPNPTGPLMKELPSSVISAANKDTLHNVSGYILSHLPASVDMYTTLCFTSYILAQ